MTNYQSLPGVNWSRLKLMRISPLHFVEAPPFKETKAVRIGRAVHTKALEPDRWDAEYDVWEGDRRSSAWKEFAAANANKTLLTKTEYDLVLGCSSALQASPLACHILHGGVKEQMITWEDEETGYPCKGRADHVHTRVTDLKITGVIGRRFPRHAADMAYHAQLAFYHDGLIASGYQISRDPVIVAVEDKPPHDVVVYSLDRYTVASGRAEYRRLLRRLIHCEETGEWPGIGGGVIQPLELPEWAIDLSEL